LVKRYMLYLYTCSLRNAFLIFFFFLAWKIACLSSNHVQTCLHLFLPMACYVYLLRPCHFFQLCQSYQNVHDFASKFLSLPVHWCSYRPILVSYIMYKLYIRMDSV
jgi:hypothetical protein